VKIVSLVVLWICVMFLISLVMVMSLMFGSLKIVVVVFVLLM